MQLRSAWMRVSAVVFASLAGCARGASVDADSDAAQSGEPYAYSFEASRRHDEPAECGARLLALQVLFERSNRKVSAVVANQAWRCTDLDPEGAAYSFECVPPGLEAPEAAGVGADLMVVLFEPAPNERIRGEAVLTLSTPTVTCEHSYDLDGELEH